MSVGRFQGLRTQISPISKRGKNNHANIRPLRMTALWSDAWKPKQRSTHGGLYIPDKRERKTPVNGRSRFRG